MATDYRHAGCTTPLLRDLPDGEPKAGAVVIAKDWLLLPSEQAPMPNSPLPVCPDCWRPGRPTLGSLEAVYKIRQPKPTDYAAREVPETTGDVIECRRHMPLYEDKPCAPGTLGWSRQAGDGLISFLPLRGSIRDRMDKFVRVAPTAQAIAEALEGPLGEAVDPQALEVTEPFHDNWGLREVRVGPTCYGYVDGPLQSTAAQNRAQFAKLMVDARATVDEVAGAPQVGV